MSTPVAMVRHEYSLTLKQVERIMNMQCKITSIVVHPLSGAVTVKDGDTTMATIDQDGRCGYAYKFSDGRPACPLLWSDYMS